MKRHIKYAASCGIEEASRWDLVLEPASLWWTSTYDLEERCDLSIHTTSGCHNFLLKKSSRSWAMLRIGRENARRQ